MTAKRKAPLQGGPLRFALCGLPQRAQLCGPFAVPLRSLRSLHRLTHIGQPYMRARARAHAMTERISRKVANKRAWAEMRLAEANARAAWAIQDAEAEALHEHAERIRAEVYARRNGPPAPGPRRFRWADILYATDHEAPPGDGHEWTQIEDSPRTWFRMADTDE